MCKKKGGKRKMKGRKKAKDFERLKIVAEWTQYTVGSDPLVESWRERISKG